jgi:minor extracellular serine protease Vpr
MNQNSARSARGTRRALFAIGLIAAALITPSPVAATSKGGLFSGAKRIESGALLRGADKNGNIHLLVTLRTPGIGALQAAGGAGESYAFRGAQIRERMSARAAVAALGGTIHSEYQYILNGLRVRIPASKLEALRAHPNVADIQLVTRYHRTSVTGGVVTSRAGALPSNASAAVEVQAKNVWAQTLTSRAGTGFGVKVAVIDSGIDYSHDLFVRNGDTTFPTAKIPLGYDLVGDDYAPGNGGMSEVPQPDSDPMDCDISAGGGHGTHVAGTIAGYGIKANGDTYGISSSERYTSSLDVSNFKIAPGMAPLATLIAIRVFGCQGGTELAADGIEKAVALGANVINLSLGSPYGIKGGAEQTAINAAEKAGVTVVVAAGNDGEQPFLVGTPSTEDGAISVAALNDRATYPAATISYQWFGVPTLVGGGTGAGFLNTNLYDLSTPLVKNIHSLKQVADSSLYSLGCPATGDSGNTYTPDWDVAGENLMNKIVILRRGECTFKEKVDAMIAKGAAAVVILQNSTILSGGDTTSYPPFQGPDTPTASIPVLMANGAAETALQTALIDYGLEGAEATLGNRTLGVANPDYHTVAEFSSGGPRWGDLALKPELAAPGVDIVSAASGSSSGEAAWFSGTSMATPVVAGVAALVKQANPKWTPALIKSVLINTSKSVGNSIQLRTVGAGRVNALNAVKAKVTIDAGPNATLSFGMVYGDSSATLTRTKTFVVKNSGTTTVGYKFTAGAAAGFTIPSGVTVSLYSGSVLLKSTTVVYLSPGQSKTLSVRLTATVDAQRSFDPGYYNDGADGDGTVLGGMLNVIVSGTSAGKPTLRLPVIAILRHTERFSFGITDSTAPYDIEVNVLTGTQDAKTSAGAPFGNVDLWPYAWLARDGRERIGNGADIKNIGAGAYWMPEDWATTGSSNGIFEIVITTWESFSNGALHEWVVELDANNDGSSDQVIVVADSGALAAGYPSGVLGCLYIDTLGWNGDPGAMYQLEEADCFVYAEPISSVMYISLKQGYFWDTIDGAKFRVSTYNGGGWDSDSSGSSWLYVKFDELVGDSWNPSVPIATSSTGISAPDRLFTLGHPAVSGGATPSLGWIFWNQWHSGPSTEIYEVLIPVTD